MATFSPSRADEPIALKIVGGLGGVRQFTDFERPFWENEIAKISSGRVTATIHAFDRSGIRGQDLLQLMKTGVIPFGNAPIAVAAADTPVLQGVDLPGMNPDFASLRHAIEAYRPKLRTVLREAYDIELLGIYSYPAQVLFCARPFRSLESVGGFRVRTSSLAQSELMTALGALPVVTPFSEVVTAINRKSVDCAITGILSGHEIGLAEVTTHVHVAAISWGVTIFGANRTAWSHLPPDVQDMLKTSVRTLEERILLAARDDTEQGFACSRGLPTCRFGARRPHSIVAEQPESRSPMPFGESVLAQWLERCGADCNTLMNEGLVSVTPARKDAQAADADHGGMGN